MATAKRQKGSVRGTNRCHGLQCQLQLVALPSIADVITISHSLKEFSVLLPYKLYTVILFDLSYHHSSFTAYSVRASFSISSSNKLIDHFWRVRNRNVESEVVVLPDLPDHHNLPRPV